MEVVVVGGGPSGSTAAWELAKNGIKVTIIEKELNNDKPCGGGIPSVLLTDYEIPFSFLREKIDKMVLTDDEGKEGTVSFSSHEGFSGIVQRKEFDAYLRNRAVKAGAVLKKGIFQKLERTAKTTVFYWSREEKKLESLQADLVFFADGVTSKVGQQYRPKPLRYSLTSQEHIKLPPEHYANFKDCCRFYFGSRFSADGYGWVFPKGDSVIDVGVGIVPRGKSLEKKELDRALAEVKKMLGRQLEQGEIIGKRCFALPVNWASNFADGEIAMLGDAAGTVFPVTGEGIFYAMESGRMAAKTVIEGKPLSHYQNLWQKTYGQRFKVVQKLGQYLMRNDQSWRKLIKVIGQDEAFRDFIARSWLKKKRQPIKLSRILFFLWRFLKLKA